MSRPFGYMYNGDGKTTSNKLKSQMFNFPSLIPSLLLYLLIEKGAFIIIFIKLIPCNKLLLTLPILISFTVQKWSVKKRCRRKQKCNDIMLW